MLNANCEKVLLIQRGGRASTQEPTISHSLVLPFEMSGSQRLDEEERLSAYQKKVVAFVYKHYGHLVEKPVALEALRRKKVLNALMKETKKAGGRVSPADNELLGRLEAIVFDHKNPLNTVAEAAARAAGNFKMALKQIGQATEYKFLVVRPEDSTHALKLYLLSAFGIPLSNELVKPYSPESSSYEDDGFIDSDSDSDSDSAAGASAAGGGSASAAPAE